MHCLLKVCVEISDSFTPCQDHSSIDGSYGLQRFLVTDTVSSSFKWATLTLGCHLDFVLEEASTSPPSPLGVIPSLGSSHSSPVYWESKQCFPKPKGRVFLFLGGDLRDFRAFAVLPRACCCQMYKNDRADRLQKNNFGDFGRSPSGPQACSTKDWRALLLFCAIMMAAHSVTAQWQQLLSDVMLSDVLLIITNRLGSTTLLVLVSAAVGISRMEKTTLFRPSFDLVENQVLTSILTRMGLFFQSWGGRILSSTSS